MLPFALASFTKWPCVVYFGLFNPGWKMRNVVIIHDRCELCGFDFFQSKQGARLRNGESVSPGLQESEKS
jgi:hypothetical protein